MLNVRLAGDHLNGKLLFIWLSHVMFFDGVFLCCPFFRDILDEIWDLMESVSEGFTAHTFSHFGQLSTL